MKDKIWIIVVTLMAVMAVTSVVRAGVIFEDNFDSHDDWHPSPGVGDEGPSGASSECNSGDCSSQVPQGWSYYRTTGMWWPPTYNDTIQVSNVAGRGSSGKAFIVHNEANAGASGDGWGADGILGKLFDQEYPELHIRIWFRTQDGWQWPTIVDQVGKVLRIGRYDGSGSIFQLSTGGNVAPLVFWDFKHSNSWGTRHVIAHRSAPADPDYFSISGLDTDPYIIAGDSSSEPDDIGMYADGNWHRLDYHVKINTYSGGQWNPDGIIRIYWDGALRHEETTVKWNNAGLNFGNGWNYIAIGGNAMNMFTDVENKGEQWYAIDDVVVSTTPIQEDYQLGEGGQEDPPPQPETPVEPATPEPEIPAEPVSPLPEPPGALRVISNI